MKQPIQKTLSRVRTPKVIITVDQEQGGAIIKKPIQLSVGIVGFKKSLFDNDELDIEYLDESDLEQTDALPSVIIVDLSEQGLDSFEGLDSIVIGFEQADQAIGFVSLLSELNALYGWFANVSIEPFECEMALPKTFQDNLATALCAMLFKQGISYLTDNTHLIEIEEIEAELNNWLAGYVLLDDYVSGSVRASYPLISGSVKLAQTAQLGKDYSMELALGLAKGFEPSISVIMSWDAKKPLEEK